MATYERFIQTFYFVIPNSQFNITRFQTGIYSLIKIPKLFNPLKGVIIYKCIIRIWL